MYWKTAQITARFVNLAITSTAPHSEEKKRGPWQKAQEEKKTKNRGSRKIKNFTICP
jgi:hypothetical protein